MDINGGRHLQCWQEAESNFSDFDGTKRDEDLLFLSNFIFPFHPTLYPHNNKIAAAA